VPQESKKKSQEKEESWRSGSRDREPPSKCETLEFKSQCHQKKKEEKGHAIQEGESNLGERREVKGISRIRAAYQARAFISSGRRRIESSRGMSLRKVTAEGTDLENTMLRG
jgi:hypothetical protein